MPPAVFVSYSHKDADFAQHFVDDLTSHVKSLWFDATHIRAGRAWDDSIVAGIAAADVVIAILSPNLLASEICKDEFDCALRLKKPVIPILIASYDDSAMWLRMGRRQYIDFRMDYGRSFERLLSELANLTDYLIPTGQMCVVCKKADITGATLCPACHAPFRPIRLADLAPLSQSAWQAYLSAYQPRIRLSTAGVEDILPVVLTQILLGDYAAADELCQRLITLQPSHAYGRYLRVISAIAGRRLRLLNRPEALMCQTELLNATKSDSTQGHLFLLLALLKTDYFEGRGYTVERPTIEECVNAANRGTLDKCELSALVKSVGIGDSRLAAAIRAVAFC